MKHVKIVFAVMLVFTLCTAFTMKSHKPVYAFGIAASFNDSVVYCNSGIGQYGIGQERLSAQARPVQLSVEKLSGI